MLSDQKIIQAIEDVDSIFPEIKGFNRYLPISSLKANITPDKTSFANRVSVAKLTEANAKQTITDVCNQYQSHNVNFIWIVGPNSTPASLGEILLQQNFKKIMTTDGMYINNVPSEHIFNKQLKIEELAVDDFELAAPLMAAGFKMKMEDSENYHRLLQRNADFLRLRVYLTFFNDNPAPVACSYLTYFPDKPIAILSGAATLESHRGHGIYTSMLIRRINDALADRIESLVITANQATSSSICLKFGFKKVCEFEIYQRMFE